MSIFVLILLGLALIAALGLLAAMYVKDKPWYGALGILLLSGPATVLVFSYVAIAPT